MTGDRKSGFRHSFAIGLLALLPVTLHAQDVSTTAVDALPRAPTEMRMVPARGGAPTAGDVAQLSLQPPVKEAEGAVPAMAEKLKEGPVEWGAGRILWWKAPEQPGGPILVGVTTYVPGKFEIAPIPFVKDGKPIFASSPQSVQFSSVGGEKEKDDIYPPAGVGLPRWVWVAFGLLGLAIVLCAIYLIARWNARRRAKIEEIARAPRILSALEEFEQRRAETDRKGFIAQGRYKPHYFALSDAAKCFLGICYHFDAEERTTTELVRELEALGMPDELLDGWEKLFEEMDVTKFTDQQPAREMAADLSPRLSRLAGGTFPISPAGRVRAP